MRWLEWHPRMESLSRMLDGMLGEKAQAKCSRHLAGCAPCRNLFEALGNARAVSRSLPTIEEHPLQQLQLPRFIPVVRAPLGPWIFLGGLILGAFVVGVLFLRPIGAPMRVISGPSIEGVQELRARRLEQGVPLRALLPGDVDLEIPHQVLLRLKPGATITWQEVSHPRAFGGRPKIILNVMQGEVLARTQKGFWGSSLEVRTPAANALVKGTAFAISAGPPQQAGTTLKVLAGTIFLSPYISGVGVEVRAGQESRVVGGGLPERPEPLSGEEQKALLETYRIGEEPLAELVIGSGPERVEELLEPALLYLGARDHPELHLYVRRLVAQVNSGLLEGNPGAHPDVLRGLAVAVEGIRDHRLSVPLRLFLGACQIRSGRILEGRAHFRWIVAHAPQDPLIPLALGALAVTAQKQMRNPELAHPIFQQIASQHPRSPEAVLAREFLRRYLRGG